MELNRSEFCDLVCYQLTDADVKILSEHGHDDDRLGVLGMEHASRSLALIKACEDPLFARNLALMTARFFLSTAAELDLIQKESV